MGHGRHEVGAPLGELHHHGDHAVYRQQSEGPRGEHQQRQRVDRHGRTEPGQGLERELHGERVEGLRETVAVGVAIGWGGRRGPPGGRERHGGHAAERSGPEHARVQPATERRQVHQQALAVAPLGDGDRAVERHHVAFEGAPHHGVEHQTDAPLGRQLLGGLWRSRQERVLLGRPRLGHVALGGRCGLVGQQRVGRLGHLALALRAALDATVQALEGIVGAGALRDGLEPGRGIQRGLLEQHGAPRGLAHGVLAVVGLSGGPAGAQQGLRACDGPLDRGLRRPVALGTGALRVARPLGHVHAAVRIDLEVAEHEGVGRRVGERRARRWGARLVLVEAVGREGPRLLFGEEARQLALHLVEGPLGHRLLAQAALRRQALEGPAHQQADRERQGHEEQRENEADAPHARIR